MEIKQKKLDSGIKYYIEKDGAEIARAYLYILTNDLHKQPFGLMEDVFVDESFRDQGVGLLLVNKVIEEAKANNCYKLICTSRHKNKKVHEFYKNKFNFQEHGLEFRVDF